MSIFWSSVIFCILITALIIAFEVFISSAGKRVIRRNYQRVIESVMMILYGTIWHGIIRRPFELYLTDTKRERPTRRFPGFGEIKWPRTNHDENGFGSSSTTSGDMVSGIGYPENAEIHEGREEK